MSRFLTDFLDDQNFGDQEMPPVGLFLGAFGKHPGWGDHFSLGLQTRSLLMVQQVFYEQGIVSLVQSRDDRWGKLSSDEVNPFGHVFLWHRGHQHVSGRLWASQDASGRAYFPMCVCVHSVGVDLSWLAGHVWPELASLHGACIQDTTDSVDEPGKRRLSRQAQVLTLIEESKERLRVLLNLRRERSPPDLGMDDRIRLLHSTVSGQPMLEKLPQVMFRFRQCMADYAPRLKEWNEYDRADLRPQLLRLPVGQATPEESLLFWHCFLRQHLDERATMLLLRPLHSAWLDMIVGEPTPNEIFCLKANARKINVEPCANLEVPSDFLALASLIQEKFVAGEPAPPIFENLDLINPGKGSPPTNHGQQKRQAMRARWVSRWTRSAPTKWTKILLTGMVICISGFVAAIWGLSVVKSARVKEASDYVLAPSNHVVAIVINSKVEPARKALTSDLRSKVEAEQAAQIKQNYQEVMRRADAALRRTNYEEAKTYFDEVLKEIPDDAVASTRRADALKLQEQAKQAAEKQQVYSRLMTSAAKAVRENRLETAAADCLEALKLKPEDNQATVELAHLSALREQARQAAEVAKQYRAAMAMAQVAEAQKRFEDAAEWYRTALKLDPGDQPAKEGVLRAQKLEQLAEQQRTYERLINEADGALQKSEFDLAIQKFKAATDLRSSDLHAVEGVRTSETRKEAEFHRLVEAGKAAMERRQYLDASKNYESALRWKPDDKDTQEALKWARARLMLWGNSGR